MKRTLSAVATIRAGYLVRAMTIGAFWMCSAGCGTQAPRVPEVKVQTPAQQEPRGTEDPGDGVSVPFVGCPSDGQIGPIDPPKAAFKIVPEKGRVTPQIAYYKGAEGSGVYAPKGG